MSGVGSDPVAGDEWRLARRFAQLTIEFRDATTLDELLARVVRAAVDVVDQCDAASITWSDGGAPWTPAASDVIAERADLLQYAAEEGPCLAALDEATVVLTGREWDRWPTLGASWHSVDARSVLSCRLVPPDTSGCRGALNLYSKAIDAFDADAQETAVVLAAHGATAVAASVRERDGRVADALIRIVESARLLPPDRLADLALEVSASFGVRAVRIFLVEHSLRRLLPYADSSVEAFDVDGTMGGRAYLTNELVEARHDDHVVVWAPLRDGVDRLGVIQFEVDQLDDSRRETLTRIAAIVAAEIVSKSQYTDLFELARRDRAMSIGADLQRDLMPPQTFATRDLSVVSAIEPAYAAAGDTCDYAYNDGVLHAAVFDAIGHDFNASVISAAAVAAYRHTRRLDADLAQIAATIDAAVDDQFADAMFITAILVTLDVGSGLLRWINAGHPPPLHIRNGRVIGTMGGPSVPPLGLASATGRSAPGHIYEAALEPGDRVLLYTDGIIEARSANGDDFGLARLREFLQRAIASQTADAEIVRRLSHAVVDHHHGKLKDDATLLMISWHPD